MATSEALDKALDHPDLILVLLSQEFLGDEWLGDKLRGLCLLYVTLLN